MPTDPITAEDVIEALRLELEYDELHEYAGTHTEERFEALVPSLRELLTRYDAQPKPRWLKPEEVKVAGEYWIWEPEIEVGEMLRFPPRTKGVFRIQTMYGTGKLCVFDWEPDKALLLSTEGLARYRFYGPLPKPPPPEMEEK